MHMRRRHTVSLGAAVLAAGLALTSGAAAAAPTAPAAPSITAAPVQVASTTDGTVAYREIGSGSPAVVLIMGYSGSMDDWVPSFVDALARNHRVVIFDNAGIGQTTLPPGTLTVPDMGNQTAALITALHLGKVDVLGWSMGTMIGQALAVDHPNLVNRLALAAAYPGTGRIASPAPAAVNALQNLSENNASVLLGLLFPANHRADSTAYAKAITSYPDFALPSSTLIKAQFTAVDAWIAGKDPEGDGVAHLKMPVLIADGTVDALDPVVNDRQLAKLIPHAQLVLYPDASHGFLFQDQAAYLARLKSFFG
jgi:pimeloyl-ACP methyl ester carboxylesterase